MIQHLRNEGTRHVHRIRDKGTGFNHMDHCLMMTAVGTQVSAVLS